MSEFKRIMVGLDFTSMDTTILEYTKMMTDLLKPAVIYFVHAEENLELDEETLKELGLTNDSPIDEELVAKLNEAVSTKFESTDKTQIHCQVVEGSPFKEMLHWSHIKNVDLLIVGKKKIENGKGVLPQKLTRKIDASVIFVPEDYQTKQVDKILIPIDFSKNSIRAMETTEHIFANNPSIEFICGHCFSLPMGWYKTGKSEEEFLSIMHKHAEKKYAAFMKKVNVSVPCKIIYTRDPNKEPSAEIMDMADENGVDLIVIGARGKTDAATMILGSTTEKLLPVDKDYPLMVVKHKGQNIGFLDALFRLK